MRTHVINRKQLGVILLTVFILLLALLFFQSTATNQQDTIVATHSVKQLSETTFAVVNQPFKQSKIIIPSIDPEQIKSYAGSKPDGAVNLDAYGTVLIDQDLRRLFDYFFTAIGELSLQQIRNQLQSFAQEQLTQQQIQQVLLLFDKYHAYLSSADQFAAQLSSGLSQAERMAILSEFRFDTLGAEMSKAFFIDEENYINFLLANKHRQNNDEFSDQQTNWLLAENNATAYQDTVIENRIFNDSQSISETDIHTHRVNEYGADAADRLAQLDVQRQQWKNTVDEYFSQRQLIATNQGNYSLQQLHDQYTSPEVRRLNALWSNRNQ
ncbi:MAG: hypothetical protein JKY19_02685 [Alcanivoracaceae bacterium]|nr:hypothetical protein [Alcanivoracaceae bacterium]